MNNAFKMCTAWLESEGKRYQDYSEGDISALRVGFRGGDHLSTMDIVVFFDDDEKSVAIRSFNMLKVPKNKIAEALFACNEINHKFRWVKFYVDTDDLTVSAEDDAVVDLATVGAEVYELCARMYSVSDDAYEILMNAIYG